MVIPTFPSHTPVCMLVTSTANMSTGVTTKHLLTVRAWTPGQHQTILDCCVTQRKHPASSLTDGTQGLHEFRPGQPTDGQTYFRKVPEVATSAFPHNATEAQGSCPVHSDPVKRYNFCKADWKRFCLLTDQSIERLLPADTSNIERAYKIFARA